MRYIKVEFMKCKMYVFLPVTILLSIGIVYLIQDKVMGTICGYVDGPMDTYAFSLLCKVFLLIFLPFCVLFCNVVFSSFEERGNGWNLVLTGTVKKVLYAKYFITWCLGFSAYAVLFCAGIFLLAARGEKVVTQVVIVPLLFSFVCFIPVCMVLQYVCILCRNVMNSMIAGSAVLLTAFFLSQTPHEKYFFFCYPYSIAMSFDMLFWRIAVSVLLTILLWCFGTKCLIRYLEKYL